MAKNDDEDYDIIMEEESEVSEEMINLYPSEKRNFIKLMAGLAASAIRSVAKTGTAVTKTSELSMRMGKVLFPSVENSTAMKETGHYLKDLREVAGLTLQDLADAMELDDKSLLEAVEEGTAALSFELTLRIAALIARHDPIPVIINTLRTYNPEAWKLLDGWGIGRIPLQVERERQFMSIYRGNDEARKLSDDGFQKVLAFTRKAFEMAIYFAIHEVHHDLDEEAVTTAEDENDT